MNRAHTQLKGPDKGKFLPNNVMLGRRLSCLFLKHEDLICMNCTSPAGKSNLLFPQISSYPMTCYFLCSIDDTTLTCPFAKYFGGNISQLRHLNKFTMFIQLAKL